MPLHPKKVDTSKPDWAERVVDEMRQHEQRYWIAGEAHCLACGFRAVMVAPYPVGIKVNGECSECHKMLIVYDNPEQVEMQIKNGEIEP
jgi:hypothetical protein